MKTNKDRRMEIINVTPEMADGWLKKNTKNRPLRVGLVKTYANSMTMGKWTLTPEAVVFSAPFTDPISLERKPETLIDGQHRLAAVVLSGKTVPMTVWFGCEPEEFNAIGQGRRRTNGDILHLTNVGLKDPFTVASAASAFLRHALSYGQPGEPWMLQEMLTLNGADFLAAGKYKHKLRKIANRQVIAALILGRMVAAKKTDDLVDQLHTGIGFGQNDPGRFIFRYLHDQVTSHEGKDTSETVFYKICNGVAYYLDGRKCDALIQTPTGLTMLRNGARKELEPLLRAIYADHIPTNFWDARISANRSRFLKSRRIAKRSND